MTNQIKQISFQELQKEIQQNNVVLIDVRTPEEHNSKKLESSILIPLDTFNKQELELHTQSNKKTVIYCKGGYRSMIACQKAIQEGFQGDIYNLEGGLFSAT